MVVVVRMLFTLCPTCFAHFGAEATEFVHELRTTGLQTGTQGTDIGAIAAKFGAEGHVLAKFNVGGGAVFAGGEASQTGRNAGLVVVMHDEIVFCEKASC